MTGSLRAKSSPLVSVIVPAFNASSTIGRTLSSIAAQAYRNIEILIVDDGSTDETAAIAKRFCGAEPRATLMRKSNGGVGSARNAAIASAAGDWIAPIDADDLWHPQRIEKMVAAALGATRRRGFVYCWHRLIDADDRIVGSGEAWALDGDAVDALTSFNVVGNGSSLLLDAKAVQDAGGYDEQLRASGLEGCEDMMLQLKIASAWPVAAVPEYLVGWRQHGSNMSADLERMHRAELEVVKRLDAQGLVLDRRCLSRATARSSLQLAERRIWEHRLGGALAKLGEALALDPVRSSLYVAQRVGRSITKRRGESAMPGATPLFLEADTRAPIDLDPAASSLLARWIRRLDERRFGGVSGRTRPERPASGAARSP